MSFRNYLRELDYNLSQIMTPTVKWVVIVNAAVFLLELFLMPLRVRVFLLLGVTPVRLYYVWSYLTYMFVHADFFHLFFNMFVLVVFGNIMERYWGTNRFCNFYLLTGILSGLSYALLSFPLAPLTGRAILSIPMVGASGAIFGVLLAFGMLFPEQPVYLYFLVPIKAKFLVVLLGLINFMALFGGASGVANLAHLLGFFYGWLFLRHPELLRFRIPFWRVRRLFGGRPRDPFDEYRRDRYRRF